MNKRYEPVNLSIPLIFAAALILLFLSAPLWASGDDLTNVSKNELTGDDQVIEGSDITTDGSLALAFAHALGDVDINDCMGSKAWGSILISHQYLVSNLWCMAEVYDAKRLYKMAAIMRCDIPDVRGHFTTDEACVLANTVTPLAMPEPIESPRLREYEEREEAHDMELMTVIERLENIEQRQSRPAQKRSRYSDEQRAAVKGEFER